MARGGASPASRVEATVARAEEQREARAARVDSAARVVPGKGRRRHSTQRQTSEESDSASENGLYPDTVARKCTDVAWLYMFLVANAILGLILYTANSRGMASRVIIFRDFQGHECGLAEKLDKPYVYLCRNDDGDLALNSAICVEACPNSTTTFSECYDNRTAEWRMMRDYPTQLVAGLACAAVDKDLRTEQRDWVAENADLVQRIALMLEVWKPVVICVVMAIVASNLYIIMLGAFASLLVWVGLFILSVVPFVFGCVFLYRWHIGVESLGLLLGAVLVLTGMCFCCISCCASYNMDRATILIELSCKCYMRNKLLIFGPLLVMAVKYTYILFVIRGIMQLWSLGDYDTFKDRFMATGPVQVGTAFCAFMILWMNNVLDACWDFCLAYVTELWYFHGGVQDRYAPSFMETEKVVIVLLRYHLGTMIQTALVVGFVKPVRLLVGFLTFPSRSDLHVPGVSCISETCCCCLSDLYKERLELLSRNAILDTALSGHSFWPAAKSALDVVRTDEGLFQLLNGATWFFQVAGLGLIVLMGNFLAFFLVSYFQQTMTGRMGGVITIGNDMATYVYMCAWVTGLVCLPFMLVFDTVSDTILYCHLVAKQRTKSTTAEVADYVTDMASYVWGLIGAGCGGFRQKSSDDLEVNDSPRTRGITFGDEASSGSSCSSSDDCSEDEDEVRLMEADPPAPSSSSSAPAPSAGSSGIRNLPAAPLPLRPLPELPARPAPALAAAPPRTPLLSPPARSVAVLSPVRLPQQTWQAAPVQVVPAQAVRVAPAQRPQEAAAGGSIDVGAAALSACASAVSSAVTPAPPGSAAPALVVGPAGSARGAAR